ncbi:TolB family protein [Streptomyces sp. NPDC058989]|uniref:TolB family protein n=1 Tax=Streptomyces sp. NPDC058989 TaxID=3346686 RepID=UPI0036A819E2
MNRTSRRLILLGTVLVLAVVAVAATLRAVDRAAEKDRVQQGGPRVDSGKVTLAAPGRLLFRNMAWGPHRDELASVSAKDPSGPRLSSGVHCLRFHAARGTGICLQKRPGKLSDGYRAVVLDSRLREQRKYDVAGIPTRARVSPSGRSVAWTVFVGGDSYAVGNFSTRTSILDVRNGAMDGNLETYAFYRNGHRYQPADLNVWGVTFADDTHFYATVATGGRTYLVRGDRTAKTLKALHTNVECPSLSPDGTRIAYKKKVKGTDPDLPWRLYVLDLRTMRETATAEHTSIDDQALWSDGNHLVYQLPGDYGADLWTVSADGSGHPKRMTISALAPAFTR